MQLVSKLKNSKNQVILGSYKGRNHFYLKAFGSCGCVRFLGQVEVWPQRGQLGPQNQCSLIAGLWVALTPLSSCFYHKAFGYYECFYFVLGIGPPTKIDLGKQLGGQTSPVGSLPLVCYNPSESVFLPQSVRLPSACLCWLMGSAPQNLVWGGSLRGKSGTFG